MLLLLLAAQAAATAPAASDYDLAAAHRAAGRHAEAVVRFQTALRVQPDNADALVGLGLSLSALGRDAQAAEALQRAVVLAPKYWDAHLGLARLALRRGDVEAARERLALVQAAEPDNADALAVARQLEGAALERRPLSRLDVWGGRSRLSRDLPAWSEVGAVLSLPLGARWSATTGIEATRRFERNDIYFEGGLGRAYASGGAWRVAVGGTPDADHRPELATEVGGSVPVGARPGLEVIADAGWQKYSVVEVVSFSPGVRWALNDRLTLQGRWVAADPSDADLLSGYAVRADVTAGPGSRFVLSWADAPESSEGRPIPVQTLSLGGARDVTDQLSLSLTASHEDRDSFTRDEVVLGAAVRF